MSGGEQQRCAVARAMVNSPSLLLADEPSGNLDNFHSGQLHDLLFALVREHGTALVVVTHNQPLAERADRVLLLRNGTLHDVSAQREVF
jgi:predicted ABC-type transport system involved in lysophospholipase L1 biosynthesis ATPase subunit